MVIMNLVKNTFHYGFTIPLQGVYSPRRNGLATGCSFVVQDKKEVVDVYNKEKTMMAAVN